MAKPEKQYGVSPVETFLREYETLQKMEALMVKVKGKYTQYTGEELYQRLKRQYEGE